MTKYSKTYKAKKMFSEFFELPKDVLLDLPRISMIGNIQFCVENHRGIIEYTDKIIRIGIRSGELVISGNGLGIKNIYSHEILVEGTIEEITFRH